MDDKKEKLAEEELDEEPNPIEQALEKQTRKVSSASFKTKGYLTMFSGFLWMMYYGSYLIVGTIAPYINSYFPDATEAATQTLQPQIIITVTISNFIGSQIVKRRLISPRMLVLIAGSVGIGGCFLLTFTKSWILFRIFFPTFYGFGIGFAYMVHLYLSWKYIPGREGILAGIINIGVGSGGMLFTFLGNYLANPDTVNAAINHDNEPNFKPFPEIADNVPTMLRTLLFIFLGLFIIALFTIQGYPDQDTLQVKKDELQTKERKYTIIANTEPVNSDSLADDEGMDALLQNVKNVSQTFHKQQTKSKWDDEQNFKKQVTTTITDDNKLTRQVTTTIADDDQVKIQTATDTKILSLHKLEEVHNKLKQPQAVAMNQTAVDANGLDIGSSTGQSDKLVEGAVDIDPETHMNQVALQEMIVTVIRQKMYLIMQEQKLQKMINKASLIQLLKTRPFLEIYFMTLGSFPLSIYLIGNLKTYGQETINIESFLAFSATFSSVFSIFRFVWSFLLEKYSYRSIYGTLLCIQIFMGLALPLLIRYWGESLFTRGFFLFVDCASKMTMGGHMVLVPTIFAKIYGPDGGMRVFSVGFSFATIASLMNTIVTEALLSPVGYDGILLAYTVLSAISLTYLIFFYKYRRITAADLS